MSGFSITQDLQAVTDAGNVTTNGIQITNTITPSTVFNDGILVGVLNSIGGSLTGQNPIDATLGISGSTAFSGSGYAASLLTSYSATASGGVLGVLTAVATISSAQTLTSLTGAEVSASYSAAATLTSLVGGSFGVGGSQNANITNMIGVKSSIGFGNSPTISKLVNFDAARTSTGTGAITDSYGFRLTDFTSGNDPTNNYGIYIPALTKGTNKYEIMIGGAGKLFLRDSNTSINSSVANQIDLTATTKAVFTTPIVEIGSGGTSDLLVDQIGLGGSPISSFFWINYAKTTNLGRGALFFDYTYTGAGPQANVLSYPSYQGSGANPTCIAYQSRVRDLSDPANAAPGTGGSGAAGIYVSFDSQMGTPATSTVSAGTKTFVGLRLQYNQGTGAGNTGGNIRQIGIQQLAMPAYAGVATNYISGAYFENNIGVAHDVIVGFDDAQYALGTTYMVYNQGAAELQTFVGGNQMIGVQGASLGFYGTAPTIQYSTPGVAGVINAGGINKWYDDTDTDGGLGGTAYTIGDVVAALKLIGILAP